MIRFTPAAVAVLSALALAPLSVAFLSPALAQGNAAQIPLPVMGGSDPVSLQDEGDRLSDRLARDGARTETSMTSLNRDSVPVPELLSSLRPIQARGQPAGSALRFDGERRNLDFALYLPDGLQARALRIATLSSINLLPERSSYQVFVNEALVGTGRLDNFTEAGTAEFALPANVIRAGANDVRIELVQYHRIYCGPEASFALWSDIDLARSGAVLEGAGGVGGQDAFLMGLAAAAATGTALELRGSDLLGARRDAWVGAITQRIAAALGGDPIPFRFTPTWSVAASAPGVARITFLPSVQPEIRFALGGDGAQVMVVGVPPGADQVPLPELDTLFPPRQNREAAPLIATRQPVPLSALGFRSVELRDRYSLTEVPFRLPDDYVVLTNSKSEMTLTYIYADDLPAGSVLQIHVNDVNIRVLPLRGQGGQLLQNFPIRFEARHLRAGLNALAFEVMVPGDPADLPCPHREHPVVAISDQSTIAAPYSPSMYLPDMHFALTALTPRGVQTGDLTARAFSALDVLTLRAALAGGQVMQQGETGARLHLTALEDLGAVPSGNLQINRRAIEHVLMPALGGASPMAVSDAPAGLGSGLLRLERQREPTAGLTAGLDWLNLTLATAMQWMHPRSGLLLDAWLLQQRGQAVLMQLDPNRPGDIWMLRAPGSDANAIAAALVAARGSAAGPRGQVSVLDADGRWHNWTAPDRQPVLLEPVSLSNIRHVLGNFVSAMPIRYVLGLFFLALVSAVFALRFVIVTRETPQ